MKNCFQIYTGNGKGKTTASLGLALRAIGHGFRVYIGQFMKGQDYGELKSAQRFPELKIEQYGNERFIRKNDTPDPQFYKEAQDGLKKARAAILSCDYQLVILDEINVAIYFGLIDVDDAMKIVLEKPETVELVFTGRNAHPKLIEIADLVTEMKEIKHYYIKGVPARKGIEM